MTTPIHPQLSHCGIYAQDVGKLVDFYTRALGLVLSDRGSTQAGELAFLTASPQHHHQLVIVSGRAPQGVTTVNQLSFKVAGLDQLKAMHRRVRDAGIAETRQVSHGNALSFYFGDPEGNRVEIYMDTPWYIPQPYAVPIDLTQSDEAIMEAAEKDARKSPGFMPLPDWEAEVARRLGRA